MSLMKRPIGINVIKGEERSNCVISHVTRQSNLCHLESSHLKWLLEMLTRVQSNILCLSFFGSALIHLSLFLSKCCGQNERHCGVKHTSIDSQYTCCGGAKNNFYGVQYWLISCWDPISRSCQCLSTFYFIISSCFELWDLKA